MPVSLEVEVGDIVVRMKKLVLDNHAAKDDNEEEEGEEESEDEEEDKDEKEERDKADEKHEEAEEDEEEGDEEEEEDEDDGEHVIMRMMKTTDVATIKKFVYREFNIEPAEQRIMFRGKMVLDEQAQPLNTPRLADIVENAGEDGIMMAFMHVPPRIPPFLEKENLEGVNKKKPTHASALHRAVRDFDLYVMQELLECEEFEHVDGRDLQNQTALHVAVTCGYYEAAEVLLKSPRFTNVGLRDQDGKNALHYAAFFGDLEMCNLILAHPKFEKKHVQGRDKNGHRSYDYAIFNGYLDVARAIHTNFPEIFPAPPIPARRESVKLEDLLKPSSADAAAPTVSEESVAPLSADMAAESTQLAGPGALAVDDEPASPAAGASSAKGPSPVADSVSESQQVRGPLTTAVADAYRSDVQK